MKKRILSLFVLLFAFALYAGEKKVPDYTSVKKEGITFSWRINGDYLDVKLEAECTGWISFGIDPSHKMKDADFVIGYVKDGKVFIQDNYGTGSVTHKSDVELGGKDDIKNASGKEEKGVTILSFSIPLDSGDKYDKKITKGKHVILLAYASDDNFTARHKRRTHFKIEIK